MLTRMIVCACLTLLSSFSLAEVGTSAEMAERYLDVQRCIERAMGKLWQEKYGIELTINRWGAVEAIGASIDAAPQVVRMTDLRCRRERDLAGQPRP